MNITREQLKLYAVTDRSWLGSETLYEQVEKALKRRRDLSAASGETLERLLLRKKDRSY